MLHIEANDKQAAGELAVSLMLQGYKAAVYEDERGGFHVMEDCPESSLVLVYDPSKEPVIFAGDYEGPDRRRFERVPFRAAVTVEKIPSGNS